MSKVILEVKTIEGDAGFSMEVPVFGLGLHLPPVSPDGKDQVFQTLLNLISDHCAVLVRRGGTKNTTPEQLSLARQIVQDGVELRVKG